MSDPRNNVIFWVGIVADPEVKNLNNGGKVAEFRFALDRAMKDSDNADKTTAWLDGHMYDNGDRDSKFVFSQIEAGNLKKGSQVAITGSMKWNSYTNKDGARVERAGVEVSGMTYQRAGEKKADSDGQTSSGPTGAASGSVINQF